MFCRKFFFVSFAILLLNIYTGFAQKSDIETVGDIGVIVVPIAGLVTTLIKGDKKGTWQFTKGFLINQIVTFGLKSSISKTRPDFSDNNSFPSGHTSTVFQGASFIHRRYGFKYSISAYAIAGFTAYSRIDAKKHDIFDVLVGAVVGIGSTYLFITPYQKEHLELTCNSVDGNYLLGLNYKF